MQEIINGVLQGASSSGSTAPTIGARREEVNDGVILYKAFNSDPTASDDDATWTVIKYIYDINHNFKFETLTGSWSGRASIAWTITP